MPEDTTVDPKPGESTPTPDPAPADAVNAEPVDFAMPEKFAGKSPEDIAKSYAELEKQFGTQGNELGTVRGERDALNDVYQRDYMYDPDSSEQAVISKAEYETRKAAQPQPEPGQLTQDEINEELRTMQEEKPQEYFNMAVDYAARKLQEGQAARNTLFATPAAQKVLSEHPDIGPRAEQIAMEQNVSLESALHTATFEKMFGAAPGGSGPAPGQPNLPPVRTSFIQPSGSPVVTAPTGPQLTDEEKDAVARYGKMLDMTEEEYLEAKQWKS